MRPILQNAGIWDSLCFTRTVGVNHIDLQAAADFGMTVARVPSYSPNAIAELSLTFAMMLFEKYCVYDDPNIFQRFSSG